MRIKEERLSKAVTINLGNYESLRLEVGLTADIDQDEDLEQASELLSDAVTARLNREIKKAGIEQ